MQYSNRFTPKIIEELKTFHYSSEHEFKNRFFGLSIDFAPVYLALGLLILVLLKADSMLLLVISILCLIYSIFHFYKIFIDTKNVVLKKYEIKILNLEKEVSFIFVADMHYGPEYYGADVNKIRKIVNLINSRNRDLVVFGGDFVCVELDSSIAPEYAKVNAKYKIGVYGNHDSFYLKQHQKDKFPGEFIESMNGSGINFLNNAGFKYNDIYFGGITDLYSESLDIDRAFENADNVKTRILLSHTPDILDFIKEKDKISLILSGHTHGGQINLPLLGPILPIPCRDKSLVKGLYKINEKLQLFITQGAGFSSTRMRIGTVCEVCEITLKP